MKPVKRINLAVVAVTAALFVATSVFASSHATDAPAARAEDMLRELDGFAAGAAQPDDITARAALIGGGTKS